MRRTFICFLLTLLISVRVTSAQADLPIYVDGLVSGFQDWSWAPHDLDNASPVQSGSRSISVSSAYWQAISFYHSPIDTALYSDFRFWAHGGSAGGQRLQVYAEYGTTSAPARTLTPLTANSWQQFVIPLAQLGISNRTDVNRVSIQLRGDGTSGTFYVDDIRFAARPAPDNVNVTVDATQNVRLVDQRHFAVNLTMWDPYFDPPHHTTTIALLKEMGMLTVRMPGGSLSDEYHWQFNITRNNTWQWQASFADMVRVATNVGAQAFIAVNYGSGTPEEAAGWVRHANVTNNLGYKFWEIGNECYGTWEYDLNPNPHSAHTYAVRAKEYIAQMKAADPTIKVGVVAVPGEDAYDNGYTHYPAVNLRTGETNYGWTPVMLSTLRSLGVTPDFLVHHHYPQWTNPDNPSQSPNNDANLLQSTGNWALDAADLRQQINDYFGEGGESIELVVTENNSDAGAQGRQSTSLVNGLYYADSLGQLLQTEFNSFVWWDLRNGTDRNGFFDDPIYGWRDYGDLGMVNGPDKRHPTFYAAKLMQWFARPGDTIVAAKSDYGFLSAYAARRTNGTLSLLVLNKSLTAELSASISVSGFMPHATATVRSFGIPNDEAARTDGPAAARDITVQTDADAGPIFTRTFEPLSMTLFTLAPESPRMSVSTGLDNGQVVLELSGQPGARYSLQRSTDLLSWQTVSEHVLDANTTLVTNTVSDPNDAIFWRARWEP